MMNLINFLDHNDRHSNLVVGVELNPHVSLLKATVRLFQNMYIKIYILLNYFVYIYCLLKNKNPKVFYKFSKDISFKESRIQNNFYLLLILKPYY